MKKSMAKVLASALSLAMAVTLVTPTDAAAASAPKFVKTYGKLYSNAVYSVKNVKKGYKVKVSVSGTAKSAVTPTKKGKKVSTIKATGRTVKFTAAVKASEATAGKGATVKVVVYNTKGKKVKTLSDGIRVMAHTTAVSVSAAATKTAINQPVDLTATLTPSYATDEVTYTVDPADGASVTDGKFVATKEGTYKVTATSNGRTSEPVEIVVSNGITGIKQTKANSFKVTFAADASKTVSASGVTVKANDDAKTELQVKNVTFSADGKEAEVTLLNNLKDNTSYTVTANGTSADFTAKIGAVAQVFIETSEAEINTDTDIDFKLFDAEGIDVTSTVNVDEKCYIQVEGDYTNVDLSTPSKAKITMGEVGKKATVKVVYNTGEKNAADVVGTKEIECVQASAKKGDVVFKDTTNINKNSGCAKFYLGLSDENVKVSVGNTTDHVYFCAKDSNDKVISYDEYKVESSNDNVATASLTKDSGKYACLTVSGNAKGSATLTVKATKNGASTEYTIPVTVKETGVAVKMELSQTKSEISNANDTEYYNEITATLKDADDQVVSGTFNYQVTNNPDNYNGENQAGNIKVGAVKNAVIVNASSDKGKGKFKVYGCNVVTDKTYTMLITGSDNQNGKPIQKNISFTVKTLPTSGTPIVTYTVETSETKLDTNPEVSGKKSTTVKLKATINSRFAGYVGGEQTVSGQAIGGTTSGNAITAGLLYDENMDGNVDLPVSDTNKDVKLAPKYVVTSAKAYVTYGTEKYQATASGAAITDIAGSDGLVRPKNGFTIDEHGVELLDDVKAKFEATKATGGAMNAYSIKGLDSNSAAYADAGYAKTGSYTAKVDVKVADPNEKDKTLSTAFTVVDTTVMPKVTVSGSKVSAFDVDTVKKDVLTTNVDMNNDQNEYMSITDLRGLKYGAYTINNNKMIVNYVVVTDEYNKVPYHFMVPVSRTFTLK